MLDERVSPGQAPVVVAVDDDGSCGDAVDWASAEAAARGCALQVVHVFRPLLPGDPYGVVPAPDSLDVARRGAEAVLAEAVARARSVASDITVSTALLRGPVAAALLERTAGAGTLVLGGRGSRRLRRVRALVLGSISAQLSTRAPCPVIVIRRRGGSRHEWSPPRVVVGVDAAAPCASAIGFAFRAARQRGIPLHAVHVWLPDVPADLEGIAGPPAPAEEVASRTLERALSQWRREFADVAVRVEVVRGAPGHALVARSRGAALLVVGTRARARLLGPVLGPVGRAALHGGHCPLAIVHDAGSRTAGSPAVPGSERGPDHARGLRRWTAPRNRRGSV